MPKLVNKISFSKPKKPKITVFAAKSTDLIIPLVHYIAFVYCISVLHLLPLPENWKPYTGKQTLYLRIKLLDNIVRIEKSGCKEFQSLFHFHGSIQKFKILFLL